VKEDGVVLTTGSKVLVVHRRLFESDAPRFFIGTVAGYDHGVARVTGNSWVKDYFEGQFRQKKDLRTKIFSVSSGTLLIYELPSDLDLQSLRFESRHPMQLWLVGHGGWAMDLSESVPAQEPPPKKKE
jgi:hypothetical protein